MDAEDVGDELELAVLGINAPPTKPAALSDDDTVCPTSPVEAVRKPPVQNIGQGQVWNGHGRAGIAGDSAVACGLFCGGELKKPCRR